MKHKSKNRKKKSRNAVSARWNSASAEGVEQNGASSEENEEATGAAKMFFWHFFFLGS
jgi:hypothetical protein